MFDAGAAQELTIAENSPTGTAVGTASASDADLPADTLAYAITAGNAAGGFAIDAQTGAITIADAGALDLDYDDGTATVAVLTVQASDGTHASNQQVTVTLTAVNEHAPVFTTPAALDAPENSTTPATIQATDADLPAQTLVYSITAGPIRRCSRSTLAPAS